MSPATCPPNRGKTTINIGEFSFDDDFAVMLHGDRSHPTINLRCETPIDTDKLSAEIIAEAKKYGTSHCASSHSPPHACGRGYRSKITLTIRDTLQCASVAGVAFSVAEIFPSRDS
jgi:hypothetical protein